MRTLNLAVTDWAGNQGTRLEDVPVDMTVGDLLAEIKEELGLPPRTPYHLVHHDTKLSHGLTLEEVGVKDDEEVTVAPEVSAG
jgi:hypothetical protein